MWKDAVYWPKWELHEPQLSKQLSKSHCLFVYDRGDTWYKGRWLSVFRLYDKDYHQKVEFKRLWYTDWWQMTDAP